VKNGKLLKKLLSNTLIHVQVDFIVKEEKRDFLYNNQNSRLKWLFAVSLWTKIKT
jgi:hypothetical protein